MRGDAGAGAGREVVAASLHAGVRCWCGAERGTPWKTSRKIFAAVCRIGAVPFVVGWKAVIGTARN
jgi:hypothetical protein